MDPQDIPLPQETVLKLLMNQEIQATGLSNLTEKTVRRSLEASLNLPNLSLDKHREEIKRVLDCCLAEFAAKSAEGPPQKRPRSPTPEPVDPDEPIKDSDGNLNWMLGSYQKQVSIKRFRGQVYVDVREYYTDATGAVRHTKKGCTLKPNLWERLVELSPRISSELKKLC